MDSRDGRKDQHIALPAAGYAAANPFMQAAIDEAREGIWRRDGGPFGSAIVRDGKIVASGHNHVLALTDSTEHGEIDAIRKAEQALGTIDLSGCVLYTTGEPCPMCLAACLWANIGHIFYGCTIADNARIGFRDERFDALMGGRRALSGYLEMVDRDACLSLFAEYAALDHTLY